MQYEILKPTTIDGRSYRPGQMIELRERQAQGLIVTGTIVSPNASPEERSSARNRVETADINRGRRG